MKVIYRAYDGVEFDSAEACVRYENIKPPYKMWTNEGATDSFDSALVVEINDVGLFIASCKERGIITDGVRDRGLYFWSSEQLEWVWIDPITRQALSFL